MGKISVVRGFQNFVLSFLSLLFIFLVLEAGLRIFWFKPSYYYPQYMFIADNVLGYKLKPEFKGMLNTGEFNVKVDINSQGLRDYERPYMKNKKIKFLGLGDSFTFGTGVELGDTYLDMLEKALNSNTGAGGNFEIIKAGVPGYGTTEELKYLEKWGMTEYSPRLIILGFCPNDPYDNIMPMQTVKNGFIVHGGLEKPPFFYRIKAFLRNHVYIYSFVVNRLKDNPNVRKLLIKWRIAGEIFPAEMQFYLKSQSEQVENCWRVTDDLLGEMKTFADIHDARLLVVLLPLRVQVYEEWAKRAIRQYALTQESCNFNNPNEQMLDICRKKGIEVLDLLPEFKIAAQMGEELYFKIDGHWNDNGHRLAAQAILRKLLQDNMMI